MSPTLPEFYKEKIRNIEFEEKEYIPSNLKKHKIELEDGIVIIKKQDKKQHMN
ncbi:MAG: hypothetical protein QXS69_03235 [Candidatus Aenigmatarchaeota archaeon]